MARDSPICVSYVAESNARFGLVPINEYEYAILVIDFDTVLHLKVTRPIPLEKST